MKKYIIDLDKDPLIPSDHWTVEEHKKGGKMEWEPEKLELFLTEKQKTEYIGGHVLRKELGENVMNANVLDFLLKNPELIPESWKKNSKGDINFIYFWGTVYRDSDDGLCVRSLCFSGGRWQTRYDYLGGGWDCSGPALRRASTLKSDTKPSSDTLTLESAFKIVKEAGFKIIQEM